ncbi:hypothetical protein BDW22DRAFT_1359670 [Trametopsis cervina]|nr:hypothetical protein BDW22DRAFT_1359670 [Trametopsis cervina]
MSSGSSYPGRYPKAPAPNDDVSAIRGNSPDEHKQFNVNTLAFFSGVGSRSVFGYESVKDLKLVEMNVNRRHLGPSAIDSNGSAAEIVEGQTICEITVKEGMLNVNGTLAGACLMHIIDITTFTALQTMGFATGIDPRGVSTSLDMRWHSVALPGVTLSIVSTTQNFKRRTMSSRAEVYDKKTGILIASATQSVAPIPSSTDSVGKAKM